MLITIFSFHVQQNSTDVTALLNAYYEIKNALVNSDAAAAAAKAGQFIKANNNLEMKTLPENSVNAFMAIQKKLVIDAEHLVSTKDITKQREFFAAFSQDFYALAKIVKLFKQPVYQQYCPMKKMYWLSNETSIKNPYYGNAMLTCGKVTDTINP